MDEILKPQIQALRERLGLPELRGALEDRVVYIKRQIDFMNLRLGRYQQKKSPPPQNHAHKAESTHSAKPSLSPSERLRANLSSRNAART